MGRITFDELSAELIRIAGKLEQARDAASGTDGYMPLVRALASLSDAHQSVCEAYVREHGIAA